MFDAYVSSRATLRVEPFHLGSAPICFPALPCGSQLEIISTTQRQVPEEREQNGLPLGVNECRAAAFQDFDYLP